MLRHFQLQQALRSTPEALRTGETERRSLPPGASVSSRSSAQGSQSRVQGK